MTFFENNIQEQMDFPVEVFIQDTDKGEVHVKEHWHNCFEFLYVLKGSAKHIINGKMYYVREKQLVVLLNSDVHAIYCEDNVHTKIFVLKFIPSMLHPKYQNYSSTKYLSAFLSTIESVPQLTQTQIIQLEELFHNMESEMEEQNRGYEFVVKGHILHFIGYLMRQDILLFGENTPSDKENSNIIKIVQYIEQNYALDLNLSEIAESLHMNYSYTSRYFKKVTGKNFKQFLDFVRVSEANKMLVKSNKNITEISNHCGFSCPQSMNRTYKRFMGNNPSSLRM